MAKPGSGAARQIAGGAVDLSVASMSDEQALEMQAELELQAGLRCAGCGRRIGLGFRFTSIDPRATNLPPVLQLSACSHGGCDFADRARKGATVVEQVEFVWMDPSGIDAPAVPRIAAKRQAGVASDSS